MCMASMYCLCCLQFYLAKSHKSQGFVSSVWLVLRYHKRSVLVESFACTREINDKIIELLAVHAVEGVKTLVYALRNKLMYRFKKNKTLKVLKTTTAKK